MVKRGERAGVEDRWHRPARRSEQVSYPVDARPGDAVWCTDGKHGSPGTLVCTGRHGVGHRWQARWVGNGQERSKSFARKTDAQAHIAHVTAELYTGAYVDSKRSATTFGTVAEEWFSAKVPKLKPSTAGGYRSLLDMTLLPRWRDVALADVTHADIQSWVTWMVTSPEARQPRSVDAERNAKRQPLSPRRAVQAYGVLKQILAYAIRTKRLAINPSDDVELPRVVHRGETALTHQQVGALVAAAGNDVGPVLLTLAYTGLRFGELAALRVADVDLARRRVLIDKAVTEVIGQGLLQGTPKTHQSRSVPILTTELAEVLADVADGRAGTDYLFPAPDGGPMRNSYLRWRFDRACCESGLKGISIKTLRHTAGSLALQLGASVVTVQKLLGHRNATTTMNVYSHMLPDDFDNLAVAMDAAAIKAAIAGQGT